MTSFTPFRCLEDSQLAFSVVLNAVGSSTVSRNFDTALQECKKINATFLEPENLVDLTAPAFGAATLLEETGISLANSDIWIGLRRNDTDTALEDYRFISGNPNTNFVVAKRDFFPWMPGQPSLQQGTSCVQLSTGFTDRLALSARTCTSSNRIMCFSPCDEVFPPNVTSVSTDNPTSSPIFVEQEELGEVEVNVLDEYSAILLVGIGLAVVVALVVIVQVVLLRKNLKDMKEEQTRLESVRVSNLI